MSDPLALLIEALAAKVAEDYLREEAGNDGAGTDQRSEPVLPDMDAAA